MRESGVTKVEGRRAWRISQVVGTVRNEKVVLWSEDDSPRHVGREDKTINGKSQYDERVYSQYRYGSNVTLIRNSIDGWRDYFWSCSGLLS